MEKCTIKKANVKAAGVAGLAALMLTIGAVGMTANASAVLPNPDTCPHSFTAEEKTVTTWKETHTTIVFFNLLQLKTPPGIRKFWWSFCIESEVGL